MKEKISKAEQNKRAKRKAIFRAAIEIFAKNGFHNTKMSDIAKEANVADGTIYLYYQNKDDLFIKVFKEMVDEKLSEIMNEIDKENNALDKLRKFLSLHVKLFTENTSYTKFFVQEIRQSPDFYSKYPDFAPINNYIDCLEKLILEAIDQKLLRPLNVKIVSRMLYGSIDTLLTEWTLNGTAFNLDEINETVIDFFHNGMKA
jgi:TetR/AcrR family fatty acid metabolism transcriptional regulator